MYRKKPRTRFAYTWGEIMDPDGNLSSRGASEWAKLRLKPSAIPLSYDSYDEDKLLDDNVISVFQQAVLRLYYETAVYSDTELDYGDSLLGLPEFEKPVNEVLRFLALSYDYFSPLITAYEKTTTLTSQISTTTKTSNYQMPEVSSISSTAGHLSNETDVTYATDSATPAQRLRDIKENTESVRQRWVDELVDLMRKEVNVYEG